MKKENLTNQEFGMVKTSEIFDLNIEEILDSWQIYDAVREIIANAIDEQILSGSKSIEISNVGNNSWSIRDYGRGLHYKHLTMNENEEKIKHPNTIGKFGIGLKDALATFHRKEIWCVIRSKYQDISVQMEGKHGFSDIQTLHALLSPPCAPTLIGTEVILSNISNDDINKAKKLFLMFSSEELLDTTKYGEIYQKNGQSGNIYINGVKVAKEDNFLFSYNITSLTKSIKDALNRERKNVERTAYSNRIKQILLESQKTDIAEILVKDLSNIGEYHDELNWIDIQEHAVKILNQEGDILFLTSDEATFNQMAVDEAISTGKRIVHISETLRSKIGDTTDYEGNQIRDLSMFNQEYQDSFEYKFVDFQDLSRNELEIFNLQEIIWKILGKRPKSVKEVMISETIKRDFSGFTDAEGVFERTSGRIIIKRTQLQKKKDFIGTLIHEVAHATSGYGDVDRDFELELTRFLGILGSKLIEHELKTSQRRS